MENARIDDIATGKALPLAESFYTIQGEGFNVGKAAYFIRLGGCDIRCSWCDSKETWDSRFYHPTNIEKIAESISKTQAQNVVITGGEPLLYNLSPLCNLLKKEGYSIFLETSGTHPLSSTFDWISLSPKKHRPPLKEILKKASEIKVVISEAKDLQWAEKNRKEASESCLFYLQPDWYKKELATPLIIEYVKNNPVWRISLQTHKFMNIP